MGPTVVILADDLTGACDAAAQFAAVGRRVRAGSRRTAGHRTCTPDTVFLRARKGEFDCVIAMYHDQGHIPAKLAGFADTVNVTLGLPLIRTSVDHGTAYDIVGTGKADEQNLVKAVALAAALAARP